MTSVLFPLPIALSTENGDLSIARPYLRVGFRFHEYDFPRPIKSVTFGSSPKSGDRGALSHRRVVPNVYRKEYLMNRVSKLASAAILASMSFAGASYAADSLKMNWEPELEKTLTTFKAPFNVDYTDDYNRGDDDTKPGR